MKKHRKKQSAPKRIHKVKTAVTAVRKQLNVANILTVGRVWAIPVIVLTMFSNKPFWAWTGVVLFVLAGITDYMDGYIARNFNQVSRFGRVLDPIADKLLVGAIIVMLAYTGRLGEWGIVPGIVILCREILVSGLREFLAEIKVGMPVTSLAKWKTACQMVALPFLMVTNKVIAGDAYYYFKVTGMVTLWAAAILTVVTGYDYWKSGRKYMND